MGHGLRIVCAPLSTVQLVRDVTWPFSLLSPSPPPIPHPGSYTSPQAYTFSPSPVSTPGLPSVQPYTEDWDRCRVFFYSIDSHQASFPCQGLGWALGCQVGMPWPCPKTLSVWMGTLRYGEKSDPVTPHLGLHPDLATHRAVWPGQIPGPCP